MAKCDQCGELAVRGVTDIVELQGGGFDESEAIRRGCPIHPVEPEVHFLNGQVISVKEWEKATTI